MGTSDVVQYSQYKNRRMTPSILNPAGKTTSVGIEEIMRQRARRVEEMQFLSDHTITGLKGETNGKVPVLQADSYS
ncbi:MAG TPA: hypothetical protein VIS48_00860 [Candidatus Kryptonia bacterium]